MKYVKESDTSSSPISPRFGERYVAQSYSVSRMSSSIIDAAIFTIRIRSSALS